MAKRKAKLRCDICERVEGSTIDCGGDDDGVPLGPIEFCPSCWQWVCPDCMHESDCCFDKEEEHSDDPTWAPPGWVRLSRHPDGFDQWERIPDGQ